MSLLAKARAIFAELPVAEIRPAASQDVCPVDIAENAARLEYDEGLTRDEADRRALGPVAIPHGQPLPTLTASASSGNWPACRRHRASTAAAFSRRRARFLIPHTGGPLWR